MYTIAKAFTFSASHALIHLRRDHPCARMHGHNYMVEVVLQNEMLHDGMVVDYGDLDVIKEWIDKTFDHQHLNDILAEPTAENLARMVYEHCLLVFPETVAVRVSETPKTWTEYRP